MGREIASAFETTKGSNTRDVVEAFWNLILCFSMGYYTIDVSRFTIL